MMTAWRTAVDGLGVTLVHSPIWRGVAMIEVEPSPSVQRAKQMLKDPDLYFAEARIRAARQVQAERAAQRERQRTTAVAKRAADQVRRATAHAARSARAARARSAGKRAS